MEKDQGAGILDEVIDKIGAPFFTTKDTSTGLGLAVCYSIAARHGATIDFETAPVPPFSLSSPKNLNKPGQTFLKTC